MTAAVGEDRPVGDVRARLHGSALRLFSEHGVVGTSLQMIADDLGVTKAAVYYHYRTKDDLLRGVVAPFLDELAVLVETARAQRGRRAQVRVTVTGLVDIVVAARRTYVLVATDPTVAHLREHHDLLREVGEQLLALLVGTDPSNAARISANIFLAGLTGPLSDPACALMDDDELRDELLSTGWRVLTLPRARRAPAPEPTTGPTTASTTGPATAPTDGSTTGSLAGR